MSRYTKELHDGRTVAYGFDHVFGYFIQVFELPDEDGEDVISLDLDNLGNGKMIELMTKYELPESQIEMVAMDLPII